MIPVSTARIMCSSALAEAPEVVCCTSAGIQGGGSYENLVPSYYWRRIKGNERSFTFVFVAEGLLSSLSSRITAKDASSSKQHLNCRDLRHQRSLNSPPRYICPSCDSIMFSLIRKDRKYWPREAEDIASCTLSL